MPRRLRRRLEARAESWIQAEKLQDAAPEPGVHQQIEQRADCRLDCRRRVPAARRHRLVAAPRRGRARRLARHLAAAVRSREEATAPACRRRPFARALVLGARIGACLQASKARSSGTASCSRGTSLCPDWLRRQGQVTSTSCGSSMGRATIAIRSTGAYSTCTRERAPSRFRCVPHCGSHGLPPLPSRLSARAESSYPIAVT